MHFLGIEVCYIPPTKSDYQLAKEELAKCTIKEINGIVVCATFIMLAHANQTMAALDIESFTQKVDDKGVSILRLIQIVGYWAAIIFAAIDIVKAFKKQDIAGLIAIAGKYAVAVGILYGLPSIFDIFKDLFI